MMKNLTKFQKRVLFFLVLMFVIQGGLIGVLLTAKSISGERLESLGNTLDDMADDHIVYNVDIDQNMPVETNLLISDDLDVNIQMFVQSEIPFTAEIPVQEDLLVPFKIGVKEYIKLDTTIEISDAVHIFVDDTIPLDQKMKVKLFGENKKKNKLIGPSVRIKSKIPVQQDLLIEFREQIPIKSVIPLDMVIIDTLPVGLDIRIPVDVKVPVRIPLNTTAKVSFLDSIPVEGAIPIKLDVPIDIPLEETSLAKSFRQMAKGMRNLTRVKPAKGAYPSKRKK